MNDQTFLVIQPVTHDLYADPLLMWDILEHIWLMKLDEDGGTRIPGPLWMREMRLAEIEGSDLATYLFQSDVAAVFRITGPTMPPASDWTDEEWLRAIAEFPPDTHPRIAAETVRRWREEADG